MQSLKDMGIAAKEKLRENTALGQEKVKKATARNKDEKEMAKEEAKANKAQAKADMHQEKAQQPEEAAAPAGVHRVPLTRHHGHRPVRNTPPAAAAEPIYPPSTAHPNTGSYI